MTNDQSNIHALSFVLIILLFLLSGCSGEGRTIPDFTQPQNPELGELPKMAQEEADRLDYDQKELKTKLEKTSQTKINIDPVVPQYNPLDGHFVSMSLVDEELRVALFSLAKNVHMNLLIDPDIDMDNKRITVNFENAPASLILDQILNSSKLSYTIDQNMIHISGFQERIFSLNFLDISATATYSVGGDVLGGDDDELNVGGLAGRFAIDGKGGKEGNPYIILESMIAKLISPDGHYTLNGQTGTLYVKDTIQSIQSISKVISHLKTMMERQILIEAQIIEVGLREGYQFGIDWNHLRSGLAASTNLVDSLSWSLESGLVLNQAAGIPTNQFNGVINALATYGNARVVSNPTLRVKHSQPALISVGTSYTYIKTVTVTRSSGIVDGTNSTEVETSSVFDGLILGVIPFIEDNNRLTLQVNPIKSDVDEQSLTAIELGDDMAVALPEVDVKELSTVIGLHNNDTIVLGGLIDRVKADVSKGFPVLESIPFLGQLVREDYKISDNKELVVILKVTIL
jgi:MSHA type pilus biogenesis protein MshL